MSLSVLVVVHNEEAQLMDCLSRLSFADQIVVVLDKCTDRSEQIALEFNAKTIKGSWDIEGDRRNIGIAACDHEWILEIDADERVDENLAAEIKQAIRNPSGDYFLIPVDNYIGSRLVRYGWGGSFGKSAYSGLFRKGFKTWGKERVHPALQLPGKLAGWLRQPLIHYVDRNLSETIRRLDKYSNLRALDLRDMAARGQNIGTLTNQIRRFFSRFFKCYILRGGWREGGYGLVLAACAGLYPVLSYLKATQEK